MDVGAGRTLEYCHTTSAVLTTSGASAAVVDVLTPTRTAPCLVLLEAVNKISGVTTSLFAALVTLDPSMDVVVVFVAGIVDIADAVAAAAVVAVILVVTIVGVIGRVLAVSAIVVVGGVAAVVVIAAVIVVVAVVVVVAVAVAVVVVVQDAVAGGFDCPSKFPPQHKAMQSDRIAQLL